MSTRRLAAHFPSEERIALYERSGFDVVHNHTVNVNPLGERVDVDMSAIDSEFVVRIAVKEAYEAGLRAGEARLQAKFCNLLGLPAPKSEDD